MPRALVIQLARLGDLLQTMPAITALRASEAAITLDVLCPAQLSPIARFIPGIETVLEWDGTVWQHQAEAAACGIEPRHIEEAERHLCALAPEPYDSAYVLNQHPRALLAGALLARKTRGPNVHGPLGDELNPWAAYVRSLALTGRGNRVHLADVFCGLCGVRPPGHAVRLTSSCDPLPSDLDGIGREAGPWVGLIIGAGEPERLIPTEVWQQWITRFLTRAPRSRLVLLGQERERAQRIQDALPASLLGRLWDATGRTSLPQLAALLARCHKVIGADTGPLHLAAAVGTPVIGWYFARARVHETGPYGMAHRIWQALTPDKPSGRETQIVQPARWPIEETITAILHDVAEPLDGWSVWSSHCDHFGAFYVEEGQAAVPPPEREALWCELPPVLQ